MILKRGKSLDFNIIMKTCPSYENSPTKCQENNNIKNSNIFQTITLYEKLKRGRIKLEQ